MKTYSPAEVAARAADYYGVLTGEPPQLIQTGIRSFDGMVGGLSPGQVVIVGAGTGVGKTRVTMEACLNNPETRVGWVSMEDPVDVLGGRLLARETGINTNLMRLGRCSARDAGRLEKALLDLARLDNVRMVFPNGKTAGAMVEALGALAEDRVSLVFLDYLQKIGGTGLMRRQEVREVYTTYQTKLLEMGAAGVLLSQLNRPEKKGKKGEEPRAEPSIHDLKESGDLENESRATILLWREPRSHNPDRVHARVAKNNLGKAGGTFWYDPDEAGMLREKCYRYSDGLDF